MQSNQEIRLYVSKNISGKRGIIFLALFIISFITGIFTNLIDANNQWLQLLINLIIDNLLLIYSLLPPFSKIIVVGPSFIQSTFIFEPNLPVSTLT